MGIVVASSAAVLRLKTLKKRGVLSDRLAAYFAPVTDGPLVRVYVGWGSLGDMQQRRMAQGRLLKLLIGSEHREIDDPWLTAIVYAQRIAIIAWIAAGFLIRR
jgi:hypothetical protein